MGSIQIGKNGRLKFSDDKNIDAPTPKEYEIHFLK